MKAALLLLALFGPVAAGAQSPATHAVVHPAAALKNRDVLSMLKAGLPADIVVAKIKTSACQFDTSPAELARLHEDKVPSSVILAMVDASGRPKPAASPTAPGAAAEGPKPSGRPRVYVSDSQSWLIRGGFGSGGGVGAGALQGGSSPQTVEIIKTFGQRCPQVVVTDDRDRAGYVILFDRESFKRFLRRRDKIAVFRRNGDALYSNSVRSVGNAVKDACTAILNANSAKH